MPHRPMKEMFSKIAMVISTTAGSGANKPIKTVSRSLKYWGILRIYKRSIVVWAKTWDEMNIKRFNKLQKHLEKDAKRYYKAIERREKLSPKIFTKVIFFIMKKMISGYDDNHIDKQYWQEKGWLTGKTKPY